MKKGKSMIQHMQERNSMQNGPGDPPRNNYKPFSSFAPKPKPTKIDMRKGVKSNSSPIGDMLDVPQKLITKQFTGKYEGPGDALERKGLVGPTGRNVTNFVADPINAIPLAKLGKGMKLSKAQAVKDAKVLKYNKKVTRIKRGSDVAQSPDLFKK